MKWFITGYIWFLLYFIIISYSFTELIKTSNPNDNVLAASENTLFNEDIYQDNHLNKLPSQDIRIITLNRFLTNINSPLINNVEDIIKYADIYSLDYALVPAISMQESNGCKRIPEDSYNCWGYGIYGTKITRFRSYKEAIAQVSKTIHESYIKAGLTNPTLLEDKWAPPSRGQWSYAVNYYISLIHNLERNNPAS
jgi:hypothetical protein